MSGRRPPKRLGRPPAIDSAETRQKILDAARRTFARLGYDATTNKDIAEEVGITTGAIYHYFSSKADLYATVYEEVQAMIYDVFEKAVVPFVTFADRLAATLDAAVEINQRDSSIAGFVVTVPDERARHDVLTERLASQQTRRKAFFVMLVEDAVARGEIAPDIDPLAVTDMLTAVTTGLARFSTLTTTDRHRDAADALKRVFDGTLLSQPAERRARAVP